MMRGALLGALALAVLFAPGLCRPARAQLTLCNRTSYIIYAATTAIHSPRSQTQGWTRIVPGDCQLARKEPLTANTYLVHARSSTAHSGPPRAWGGNYPICVRDGDFAISQAVTQPYCTAEGTFALPFAPLDNHGKTSWTMNFGEQPAMGSLTAAQLAGVKRLLKDNGYPIAAINAKPDKTTGTALNDFRKRMHFAPTAGNAELFTALEREAAKKTVPAGYTVCNDGSEAALVALGQMRAGKATSRGWWTVPARGCAKLLTVPLADTRFFLLAQRRNGAPLAGGPRRFCIAPQAFEINGAGGCGTRGFGEAGFVPTDNHGAAGLVVHLTAAGLGRIQAGMLK
jgi:uncharacterized membrane protein